jgi:hypothetical protein
MSMLRICSAPNCTTRTLGDLCIDHEPQAVRALSSIRQRPAEARLNGLEAFRIRQTLSTSNMDLVAPG